MKATDHELQKHDKFTRYQQCMGFADRPADASWGWVLSPWPQRPVGGDILLKTAVRPRLGSRNQA